jgi:hypothetical protein
VLDRAETTRLRVIPAPAFTCYVGVQSATGSFLVKLDADGTLRLPASGAACAVELGPPYVRHVERFDLAPGAEITVSGQLAAGRERRVRFVDPRDGSDVRGLTIEPGERERSAVGGGGLGSGGLVEVEGGVIVPPELAGSAIAFRVAVPGFKPRQVELATDAPRDQDLLLDPE